MKSSSLIRKASSAILGLLFLTNLLLPTPARAIDADDPANIVAAIQSVLGKIQQGTQTATEVEEKISDNVLDKIAINLAKITVKKLIAATQAWVAGGGKGNFLTVRDLEGFLQESGDAALRQGLNALLASDIIGTDYEPGAAGEIEESLVFLPSWIKDYLMETYNAEDEIALEKFTNNVGIKEITNYCNGSGPDACNQSPAFQAIPLSTGCPNDWADFECRLFQTRWNVTVALNNGQLLSFATTGYNVLSNSSFAESAVPVRPDGVSQSTLGAEPKPYQAASFDRGDLNAYGREVAQRVIGEYHSTLAGTVETTLKEQLGPQWLDYPNDATVGYNPLKPYGAFEALLESGNNPIGTAYETGNRIALQADKALASSLAEITSPGFLPDKTCEVSAEMGFADGTVEEICKKFKTNTPAGLVGDQVGKAITQSFDVTGITKWEQLGIELLAEAADAVITGGLEYAAGEIRNQTAETTAQITQLGPLSYLFGRVGNELNLSDDTSWQKLTSREIDFSDLNRQINLTAEESSESIKTKVVLESLAPPTMILDQQCVFGPDFGWEERLKENYNEDSERLRNKVQDDARDNNLGQNQRARKNFLEFANDQLEKQITWVKEAMPSNPFPYQIQFMATVNKIPRELQRVSVYADDAEKKQSAATTLAQVRQLIKEVQGGEILLQKPPVWQDDIDASLRGLGDFGSINVGDQELTRSEILRKSSQSLDGYGEGLTDFDTPPSITVQKPTMFLPQQAEEFIFDVSTGILALDREDGDITDNVQVSIFNQSLSQPVVGTEIDLSEFYEVIPATATEPAVTAGMTYRVTYSVTDSAGNPGVDKFRIIKVKTYDDYLDDLTVFSADFTSFLDNIARQPLSVRSRLSQAVNLYLGVEKDISSETSLRDTIAARERANQTLADINDQLDQCWLALYQLDKLIDPDTAPGVRDGGGVTNLVPDTTLAADPVGDGVLASAYASQWEDFVEALQVRTDARIPYVQTALPYQLQRGTYTPVREVSPTDILTQPLKNAFDKLFNGGQTAVPLTRLIQEASTPDIRYTTAPDFECNLDAQILLTIDETCGGVAACANAIYDTYEKYHCISSKEDPAKVAANVIRKNDDNSRIADAYGPGRRPIGTYELWANPNTNTGNCPTGQGFKSNILDSPIDNCSFLYGTMVHRVPSIEESLIYDEVNQRGLYYNSPEVQPFMDVWGDSTQANFRWPVQFSGYYPSATSSNRTWVEGVMHTQDVYGAHTRGTLYCDTLGPLTNTLHGFNERLGVTESSKKNDWWDGTFDSNNQPKTAGLSTGGGFQYWKDIQRCEDWTKSDLSSYLEFPKVSI